MKKLAAFIIAGLLSMATRAQENKFNDNPLTIESQKNNSELFHRKKFTLPDSLKILPKSGDELSTYKKFHFQDEISNRSNHSDTLIPDNSDAFYSRMPLHKPPFSSKMPVMKIDTTVHYYIKEKRIRMINPGERK